MDPVHRSFASVTRADIRLLIIGSLPGARSLERQQYYAHPRNQFWRLTGALTGRDLAALPYRARLEALLDAGIGLWDTVGAARRLGSLDAAIRVEQANDLPALAASLPRLAAIGFNGGTAARLGRRQLGADPGVSLIDLPSSSPAYTLPFKAKLERWLALRPFL
jgi:double-stranded uracil-DNA glycosylase